MLVSPTHSVHILCLDCRRPGSSFTLQICPFSFMLDLSSLFHWNTKQLVVYAVAEYSTPTHPKNQIVLWDSIIKRKSDAVIRKRGLRNKYSLIDVNKKWSNVHANVSLHWNIVPYVGFMTYGRSQPSEAYAFPLPSGVQT
ncbi:unnamed protein product [Mortierella alpina]